MYKKRSTLIREVHTDTEPTYRQASTATNY